MEITTGMKKESNGWEYYELKMKLDSGRNKKEISGCDDPVYYRNAIRSLLKEAKENNLNIEVKDKYLIFSNELGAYGDIANERVVINLGLYE